MKNGWGGRWYVVPANIFSWGDIFSGGVEIFSGGGWLRYFQGGGLRNFEGGDPPPRNLILWGVETFLGGVEIFWKGWNFFGGG